MSYAKDMRNHDAQLSRSDAGLANTLRVSVMRLSRRLRNEREASTDLSANQLAVLGTLWRQGPLTIGELASAEKVQPPSMTRTVTCLCEQGLLRRDPHPTDGRLVVVSLTDAADSALAESRRRKEAWLNRRLSELTAAERQILRAAAPVLERLSQA
ncbi:MAG: MarR family transcriptional regulator [Propionibacteriales bacterium]|nr:MarR family transcriptional regulator [Propionibacteriales bacterium]